MKPEASWHIYKEYSNIKFYKNLSSESQVVPCRQTDEWTNMTQLIDTFHSFSSVPKNEHLGHCDNHEALRKLLPWMENMNSSTL
jgi:hypothetical protein